MTTHFSQVIKACIWASMFWITSALYRQTKCTAATKGARRLGVSEAGAVAFRAAAHGLGSLFQGAEFHTDL